MVPPQDCIELPDWISDNLSEAYRGVFRLNAGLGRRFVLFGNDPHDDKILTFQYVELIREWLEARGYKQEFFGVSSDQYTWCLVALLPAGAKIKDVREALWSCWAQCHVTELFTDGWEWYQRSMSCDALRHLRAG
jgi:hypothetical protein